jgi:hypothetical protein
MFLNSEYKGNGYKPKFNGEPSYDDDEHEYKQQHPKPHKSHDYKGDGHDMGYNDISYKGDKYYEVGGAKHPCALCARQHLALCCTCAGTGMPGCMCWHSMCC